MRREQKVKNVKTVKTDEKLKIVDHSSVFSLFLTFSGFPSESGFRRGENWPTVKREKERKR